MNGVIVQHLKRSVKMSLRCFSQILGDRLNLPSWQETRRWQMNHVFFKLLSTAVDSSSRLLCSHICKLGSWMFGENYSLICGKPDWRTALPYQIQTLRLRVIKDAGFAMNIADHNPLCSSLAPIQKHSNLQWTAWKRSIMFSINDL